MLKLTLKPGEYINIGDNVKVVFSGGSANNIHLLVDAPREIAIVRSNANTNKDKDAKTFYKEKDHIRLQPENHTMEPIIVPDCRILGKVAGVFRKM